MGWYRYWYIVLVSEISVGETAIGEMVRDKGLVDNVGDSGTGQVTGLGCKWDSKGRTAGAAAT